MNRIILIMALSAALVSCGGRTAKTSAPPQAEATFPMPSVPGLITDPAERLTWLCLHFWDDFTAEGRTGRCDSSHVAGVPRDAVEEQFGLFSTLLVHADLKTVKDAMDHLYERAAACEMRDASSNVFETFVELTAHYFFDPNSPIRNEECYLHFVERLAESPLVSEGMRAAYAYDAGICRLNRPGTAAADFRFTDLGGHTRTLYGIKAPYTLLFFSNPGCESCKEVMDMLQSSEMITDLISSGTLAVVNVYIDDALDEWKAYAVNYPSSWYSGYDADYAIRTDMRYAVRAIPSLYLLDENKTVIYKDAYPDFLMETLSNVQ